MSLDWDKLKISQAELDKIVELNIISTWAMVLSRVFLLRQGEYRQSLIFTESSFLFIGLLFFFPINLITFRKLGLLNNNSSGFILVIVSTFILSSFFLTIFNYYLWQKAKKIKTLAKLVAKVDKYNDLISNFQILANLNLITNDNSRFNSQTLTEKSKSEITPSLLQDGVISESWSISELKTALNLTKNSLLKSIELETFLDHHQIKSNYASVSFKNRYQLLANLEHNLINLSLPETDSHQEYQQLLNEAVNIGLSVHQEMRKITTIRQSLK